MPFLFEKPFFWAIKQPDVVNQFNLLAKNNDLQLILI